MAPICQSANGQAAAGLRLKQFVESFGTAGSLFGICNDDFSPALQKLGATVADKIGSVCVSAPVVDAVPTDPGVQADCQVLDRIPSGNAFADEAVPPCSGGSRSAHGACWQLVADTLCDASGFKIVVDRGGNPAIPGTEQVVRCLTCADANDPRCKR